MLKLLGRCSFAFIFFVSLVFGVEEFERVCDEEVLKEDINISVVEDACFKRAINELKKKAFSNASWYFLLTKNNRKNIDEIQEQINDGMFVNIGHSYLLENNLTKALQFYKTYIEKEIQPNNALQIDFKLLAQLYPKKKKLVKQGLKAWNKLYHPLLELDRLYKQYTKEEQEEKFQNAINSLKKIIILRKQYSKKESETISIDYNNLALLYAEKGEYLTALKFTQKSLKIVQEIFGFNHYQIAISHSNLAYIYEKMSNFKEAKENNIIALQILQNIGMQQDHSIATIYNNLAFLYGSTGDYVKALDFYQKSLKIDRNLLDVNATSIAITLNNLGELSSLLGEYSKAMSYYQDVLKIDKKAYGEKHTITAHSYNNIAQLYELLEDYKRAKQYYSKAIKITKERVEHNHPFLATLYANLGNLYYVMGKDKASFEEHKKALDIRIFIANGEETIDLALSYHAIGLLYQASEDYNKALEYFQKTLAINQKLLPKNHIANAVTYSSMGAIYQKINNKNKALEFYMKAIKLEKKVLGLQHRDLARSYNSLSILYFSQRKNKEAYTYSQKAFKIFQYNQKDNFNLLDNKQKRDYNTQQDYYFYNLLHLTNLNKNLYFFQSTINIWLNYKGTLFEYQNILSMIKNNPKASKETIENINNLNLFTRQLSNLKKQKKEDTNKIKSIKEQIHNIEIALSKSDQKFKTILNLQEINASQIAQNLQAHQLYIDFVRGESNYYLFTLDHENQISFQQIDTNSTQLIDQEIKAYRTNTEQMAQSIANHTVKKHLKNSKKEAKVILASLYNHLIEPYLQQYIKNKTHLIVSPDGLLNLMPLEALYHKDKYFIEKHKISYISSGKEFIRQSNVKLQKTKTQMTIFASANFDALLKRAYETTLAPSFSAQAKPQVATILNRNFEKLGDIEVDIIRKYYPHATIYRDDNASVKNLMNLKSTKILHLSTHGLWINDKNILNPMRKSLLIFAGGNQARLQGDQRGIISALKLSTLDLRTTELVVLSACQSGVGKIQKAEGVLGLPKALIQAGAKQVIMSLWIVSNQKTAKLMDYFYASISEKEDYTTALQTAKLKMINLHPYYWSAFILSGI